MQKILTASLFIALLIVCGCSAGKLSYTPEKKFSKKELLSDYLILRNILEKKHPSLYWYTPKDSMDYYFDYYQAAIGDSMTERSFTWKVLAPLTSKIRCGHTSVSLSKAYSRWAAGRVFPSFPLALKIWNDSMLVLGNMHKQDSLVKRGMFIHSVNGLTASQLQKDMFDYLPRDGYADQINYLRISSNFRNYHRNIYGLSKNYQIGYRNTNGEEKIVTLPLYMPDTSRKKIDRDSVRNIVKPSKKSKSERLAAYRSLQIDSTETKAYLTLNSFSKGGLRRFFRRSFKTIKHKNIQQLVIDIRNNGGGRVGLSTLFTRYLSHKPFKVSDSLFAVAKSLKPYSRYIKGKFLNNIEMAFISHKKSDGMYHIGHLERKVYQPKKKLHYNGNLYVLISGPTFSAASLVANALKGQERIVLLGEETGGGWYGNNGIMIPDIILPHTKTRIRLPLYRLVQYNHPFKTGSGVVPDIPIGTNYDALLKGIDFKKMVVMQLLDWK